MSESKALQLPQCASMLTIKGIRDERGQLCFTGNDELPFDVKRVFWIAHVPEGQTRGKHAHRECAEIIFPVQGGFDIFVSDDEGERTISMSNPCEGIYIGPNVWCELRNFRPNTVCVVLASHPYLADGYINDYNEFLAR